MSEYYFDIETTGIDLDKDKIITIQFQQLGSKTGIAIGKLTILESWRSSEEDIIKQFLKVFRPEQPFEFIPVGVNLPFDFFMLHTRCKYYGIDLPLKTLLYVHPFLDLKTTLVMANKGMFRGASLEGLGYKSAGRGSDVPVWFLAKNYKQIEEYILNETKGFIEFYSMIKLRYHTEKNK